MNTTIPSLIMLLVLWAAHFAFRELFPRSPGDPVRLAVTAFLILAFGVFIIAHARLLRSLDEFHRQVQFTALSVAFPAAVVLVFAVGFLRGEGLLGGRDPRDLWVLLLLPYVVSYFAATRRYR